MRDDMPRTVEFRAGRVTEVVWENTPMMGQIQIMNVSGDDNQINGLPRGTPLAGVVFEVYHHRTGNLIDRFVSGADGRAVSRPLPLGRYTVRQVDAPQWYKLSTEALDIEIEFATQIIRRDFQSFSANTGVRIRQTGPNEVMSVNDIIEIPKSDRDFSPHWYTKDLGEFRTRGEFSYVGGIHANNNQNTL